MKVHKREEKFDWDEGNNDKNFIKHNVTNQEAEEVFFDPNKVTFPDLLHSGQEERLRIIGKTTNGRLLLIVFTKREDKKSIYKIRIISARDVNNKEEPLYEKAA